MSDMAALLGRALLSVIFLFSGFNKFMSVGGVVATMQRRGLPYPDKLGYVVAACELLGGLAVLLGFKARYVALAMFVFTAATIYVGHNFWDMEGQARAMNQTHAMKNLAIMGGFLLLAAFGPGRYSVDGRSGGRYA